MEVLDHLELNDSHLLAITTGNASSDSTRTGKLETTSEASAIEWAALRNHIPHMVHAIQLALGAFIRVWVYMASPSLGKPMNTISNLERMNAYTLRRVKDFL
jgi:hypothetical protein